MNDSNLGHQTDSPPRVPKGMNFAVLRAIPALGVRACGTEIREHLSKQIDQNIPAAKIYVALARLKDAELVIAEDEIKSSAGKGLYRRRKIYRLTVTGLQALEVGIKLYGSVAIPNGDDGDGNTIRGEAR